MNRSYLDDYLDLLIHSGDLEMCSHILPSLKIDGWKTFQVLWELLVFQGNSSKDPKHPSSQPPSSCLYCSNWGRVFPDLYLQPSYLKKRSFSTRVSPWRSETRNSIRIRYRPGKGKFLAGTYLDHINPENELFSIIYRYARYRWCPRTLGSLLQRFWLFAALYPNSTKLEGSQAIKRLTMSQCLCQNDSSSKWIKMDDFQVVTRGHIRFCQVLCGSEGRG